MDQLAIFENVPRKEKQFRNFTVNSLKLKGSQAEKIKDDIWTLLIKVREESKIEQHSNKVENPVLPDRPSEPKPAISDTNDEQPKTLATQYPSEKAVTKAIKKVLKKAPNKQLKFKVLRKQVRQSFSLNVDESGKKKWNTLLRECVDANPKRLIVDGKVVTLIK